MDAISPQGNRGIPFDLLERPRHTMKTIRTGSLACLLLAATFSATTRADSFDDAVTQFLKGFEYCKEAKSHLSGGRLPQAQAALQQYQTLLAEATRINRDILTTNQRDMDGNLKYCQRVSRDVEVEVGMPAMNQALAACDAAQQALQDQKPEQARQQLAEFRQRRDNALKLAPSLGEIFTVKNQISRCERIESKIASSSMQQQALQLSLETAREESAAYAASCQKTLDMLKSERIDDPVLRDANQGLASTQSHKKNVRDERLAQQAFANDPQHPMKKIVDANMANGDRCSTELTRIIAEKQQELRVIAQHFSRINGQLTAANMSCQQAQKSAASASTQSTYDTVRTDYENALRLRNSTRDTLGRDERYGAYQGRDDVAQIEKQMQTLNRCLESTKTDMAMAFARLPQTASTTMAAPAKAEPPAPTVVAETTPVSTPARLITGTLRINDLAPEFALLYTVDNTLPQAPDIVVERAGFDQPLYIASSKSNLNFKNRDNTAHRISASNDAVRFSDTLVRLQPRQTKSASVNWPENTVVTLRSDRGTFANSYIANLPTANYQQLAFSGNREVKVKFANEKGATSAYLVMPDMDVLTFTLARGETKSLAITRAGVPVGSLVVTGE